MCFLLNDLGVLHEGYLMLRLLMMAGLIAWDPVLCVNCKYFRKDLFTEPLESAPSFQNEDRLNPP